METGSLRKQVYQNRITKLEPIHNIKDAYPAGVPIRILFPEIIVEVDAIIFAWRLD